LFNKPQEHLSGEEVSGVFKLRLFNMKTVKLKSIDRPTLEMFIDEVKIERIYKYVKACIISNWNYDKNKHYLGVYFNKERKCISMTIISGNTYIQTPSNVTIVMDISYIKEIQQEYREKMILNEAKLKYLLSDEKISN
jgi:hypothetical protein